MMMRSTLCQTNTLIGFLQCYLTETTVRGQTCPPNRTHYPDSEPVFALSPYCCTLSSEATNTNLIVFDFTHQGLEPTIYRTRGEQANQYTIDTVDTRCVLITFITYDGIKYNSTQASTRNQQVCGRSISVPSINCYEQLNFDLNMTRATKFQIISTTTC